MIDSSVPSPSCVSCISRRGFLVEASSLAAVVALFAACGSDGGVTPPQGKVDIKVSDFAGLATINQPVLIDGLRAAKRTSASTFVAWSRLCTHEGTPVNVTGNGFVCPNHGSRFDNSGTVTLGPATQALVQLPASYNSATDTLTIG